MNQTKATTAAKKTVQKKKEKKMNVYENEINLTKSPY